jgi:pimeloyl-ACP methyl ester carboxylesterase
MTIARLNGIEIYYEEHGDRAAEPVLLIMGQGVTIPLWVRQIPALEERYHVVSFDNRGTGRTSQPEGPYTMEQMSDDAVALLDHLGIESAHIIGQSMGGMIAQYLALRYPDRVRSLVLACTSPRGPDSVDDSPLDMTPAAVRERLLKVYTPQFLVNPGPWFGAMWAEHLRYPATPAGQKGQAHAGIGFDVSDRLPEIHAPTLVITGDADGLVDPANSRILAERIAGAEMRVFEGLRHGFMQEGADEVNAAILDFLARHAAPAA